jgi:hypothetical protein
MALLLERGRESNSRSLRDDKQKGRQLQLQLRLQSQWRELAGEVCTFPPIAVRLRWMGHPFACGRFRQDNGRGEAVIR